MSHWFYNNKEVTEVPEDAFGFVYMITNTKSGRKYIGRKYLQSTRRKALTAQQKRDGKKRRTRVTTESNWRTYTGSSKPLLADIKELGKDHFKFEILIYGNSKGQVNYLEMKFQFINDVTLDPLYYNDTIGSGKFATLKDSDLLLENIQQTFSK